MEKVSSSEAVKKFSRLLQKVIEGGESITITHYHVPIAEIVPFGRHGIEKDLEGRCCHQKSEAEKE